MELKPTPVIVEDLKGDKANMLTHTYPHKLHEED